METKDKRVKREIANSNERRRMQSINAGFQKLKRLLPVNDGEKLSKASILQHASDFIQQTEREKLMLYEQNTLLRGILMEIKGGTDITTALQTINLDAFPTIPISTHGHTNSNNTIDPNNNDDCIRGMSSSNNSSSSSSASNQNISTSTNININSVHTTSRNAHRNTSNNKEVNKNNGNHNRDIAAAIHTATAAATTTTATPTTISSTIPPSAATTTTSTRAYNINSNNIKQELPITCPKNGVAKAAIALPLEVPCYTRLDLLIHAASSDLSK